MINNSIVMTDDSWSTAKMAVGKFYDQNLGMCWGVVAPMIVGTLLAGNELVIESTAKDGSGNSVFHVDGEGVRLYNGDIGITKGSSQIVLNPQVGIAIGKYPVYTIDDMGAYSINTDNAKFWVDSDGNLNFTGVLKGASGEFKGAIKATSLEIVGEDETTTPISTYIDDRAKDVSDGAVSIAQKTLQNNIDTVSQSVADTKTELQENIDDVNNVVNNNSQNIETIESKTNSALNQIADTQTEVIQLQEASSTAAENIEVLNTKIALANDGISVVQTATSELEGRVTTIESGVHISGSEIGIYSSNSPYKNTITNDGWVISEDGQPVITCAETKLTAPRVQITDALIIGNLAWKPGSDNHLRLLKYGR